MASLNISDHEHEERLLAVSLAPRMFEACLGCATAGILLFMCIYGLNLHLETPTELRRGQRFYVAISFLILILHGFGELPFTYYIFRLLYKTSNWHEAYSFQDELARTWWALVSYWGDTILVWVGDGLLVYRCHKIWTGRPLVTVLPATIYLAAVGVSVYETATAMTGPAPWNTYVAWVFLSVGLNCIVTFLISLRLFHIREEQAAFMAPIDSKVYIGVISILVESALPLTVAGVVAASSQWVRSQSSSAMHNYFDALWYDLSALAPALIIFRVIAGRSLYYENRKPSQLSTLAFQPHTSRLSGEREETEALPFEGDIEKNERGEVPVILDRNTGPYSDFTKGPSMSEPPAPVLIID